MTDYEKLEMIHCAIQEVIKLNLPSGLEEEMENALKLVEDLREPHLLFICNSTQKVAPVLLRGR